MACRQSLWLLHTGGLPVGPRTGGSGLCPITDAMRAAGHTMGRAAETHEQITMRSPTARLVWRHAAAAWRAFCPDHSWAASAEQDGRPSDDACRAILLGLRSDGERALREPFALLRGLTVHEIVRHRHAVWLYPRHEMVWTSRMTTFVPRRESTHVCEQPSQTRSHRSDGAACCCSDRCGRLASQPRHASDPTRPWPVGGRRGKIPASALCMVT